MTFEPLTIEILVYYPVQYGVQSPVHGTVHSLGFLQRCSMQPHIMQGVVAYNTRAAAYSMQEVVAYNVNIRGGGLQHKGDLVL